MSIDVAAVKAEHVAKGILPLALIEEILQLVGPALGQLILNWLSSHKQHLAEGKVGAGLLDIKPLVVGLLKQYRDAILALADEELAKAYDLLVSKLSA